MIGKSPHLRALESESISIILEVVSQFRSPVMLYSIGKDSAVMLHLALKAFRPGKLPFSLLHVDTTWKFREMISFRDEITRKLGVDLIVHINQDGVARGIDPVRSGSALHTQVMKTDALKQALDKYGFDAAFGGARRDEEKSRAKERILSFRNAAHVWEPRQQRPELWTLFNTRIQPGESIRAFPLSNWTELDVWEYIKLENIPVVPLYFAKVRPVVRRAGTLVMVDDKRLALEPGESVHRLKVRFRTLGCYPLTGAVESDAESLEDVINEVRGSKVSERQGRLIDSDSQASMERKKREGYF
jgi:sulfate adenylyltransferase subunit 2